MQWLRRLISGFVVLLALIVAAPTLSALDGSALESLAPFAEGT